MEKDYSLKTVLRVNAQIHSSSEVVHLTFPLLNMAVTAGVTTSHNKSL